jgi:hypothetical protein
MASFRGHLGFAAPLGAGYGSLALLYGGVDHWGSAFLGAGLTTLGGMLPDLDSDSGVPVRELFALAAALVPLTLYTRLEQDTGLYLEQVLVILGGVYLLVRYGLSALFKRLTVHRGMFHSIPAMCIAGLAVYLLYPTCTGRPPREDLEIRLYLAGAVMLGFLSHLVLDEIYSVDFMGVRIRLNKYAGSALKFFSKSTGVTLATYVILAILAVVAWRTFPVDRLP